MNRKAADILLELISRDTEEGWVAFNRVAKFVNPAEGYSARHFPKAWAALIKFNKKKEDHDAVDCEAAYFDKKMEEDEHPADFILKMEEMLKIFNESLLEARRVDAKTFMGHILTKLPKSDDPKMSHPYQVKREMIEDHMKRDSDYDLVNLTLGLIATYNQTYGHDGDGDGDSDVEYRKPKAQIRK